MWERQASDTGHCLKRRKLVKGLSLQALGGFYRFSLCVPSFLLSRCFQSSRNSAWSKLCCRVLGGGSLHKGNNSRLKKASCGAQEVRAKEHEHFEGHTEGGPLGLLSAGKACNLWMSGQ